MTFELKVAIRYFKSGGMQSVLTVMGVSVGVTVFIFISSLIGGVQKGLIDRTIGSSSQLTVEPKDNNPRTLEELSPARSKETLNISRVEKFGAKEQRIDNWKPLITLLEKEPGLTAVSPSVSGPGIATRGNQIKPITYRGVEPDRANKIIDLRSKMVRGTFDVSAQNCCIGVELAKDLGVGLKDKIRTRSGKGRELTFTVAGIFDAGILEINQRTFFLSLTNAQRLLDLVGYITAIETKVREVFQANILADKVALQTGLQTKSWMRQNKDLLGALQGQDGSNLLIKVFVMLSIAFGIASVLVVSVVQKSREVGILKSMGARTRSIILIFLLQGFFVGLIGSIVGFVMGSALVLALMQIPGDNPFTKGRLFPAELQLIYGVQAMVLSIIVGTLAGIAPARRAAKLDPVEVIRYG